ASLLNGGTGELKQLLRLNVESKSEQEKILQYADVDSNGNATINISPNMWYTTDKGEHTINNIEYDQPITALEEVIEKVQWIKEKKEEEEVRDAKIKEKEAKDKEEQTRVHNELDALIEEHKNVLISGVASTKGNSYIHLIDGTSIYKYHHDDRVKAIQRLAEIDDLIILRNVIAQQKKRIADCEAEKDKRKEEIIKEMYENQDTLDIEDTYTKTLKVVAEPEDDDC
ncbi:MAG: hypothetical protein H8D26_09485, partial [Methanomicrobia archaeon]|nr:hypothetical protein [Methanomicrobia archaeon]